MRGIILILSRKTLIYVVVMGVISVSIIKIVMACGWLPDPPDCSAESNAMSTAYDALNNAYQYWKDKADQWRNKREIMWEARARLRDADRGLKSARNNGLGSTVGGGLCGWPPGVWNCIGVVVGGGFALSGVYDARETYAAASANYNGRRNEFENAQWDMDNAAAAINDASGDFLDAWQAFADCVGM